MPASPLSQLAPRVSRALLWSVVGTAVARMLAFLSTLAVARLLGKESFGELGIIQATVAMFQVLAGLGLGLTATKYVAQYYWPNPKRAGSIIAISDFTGASTAVLVSAAIYLCAPWLATEALGRASLVHILRIASLTIGFTSYTGVLNGTLAGLERFRLIAHVSFASGLLAFPLIVVGTWHYGLEGAVWGLAASSGVTCILTRICVHSVTRKLGILVRLSWGSDWSMLWAFSIPAFLNSTMIATADWVCNSMLIHSPDGFLKMGAYSAAVQVRNILLFLPAIVVQSMLPILASIEGRRGNPMEFRRIAKITQGAVVVLVFPLGTLLMFLAHPILALYGREFEQETAVLQAVILSVLIQSVGVGCGPTVEARGRMWMMSGLSLAWGLAYLLTVGLTVARLGALSLAYGSAVLYAILALVSFRAFREDLPDGIMRRGAFSITAAAAILAACVTTPAPLRVWAAAPMAAAAMAISVMCLAEKHELVQAAASFRNWIQSVAFE